MTLNENYSLHHLKNCLSSVGIEKQKREQAVKYDEKRKRLGWRKWRIIGLEQFEFGENLTDLASVK